MILLATKKGTKAQRERKCSPLCFLCLFVANLLRDASASRYRFAATNRDKQVVADGFDLRFHVAAKDILERALRDALLVRCEKRGHACSREDLLWIGDPLQDPIRAQPLMCQLKIRSHILRRFPGRNDVTCWMTALAL